MGAPRLIAALLFSLLGLACVWAMGPIQRYAIRAFLEGEPAFAAPVQAREGVLAIRRDVNGKGHYGASRNGKRTHKGIDILSAVGDPVYASKSGRIVQSGWQKGYGGVVKIAHPGETLSVYAHLSRVSVRQGQWVAQGALIGRTGKSGNASERRTLPHVHFELRYKDTPFDPILGPLDKKLKLVLR
jgi:murein DD-endopeptidase MepM/ murein hydrolase activator NlpD